MKLAIMQPYFFPYLGYFQLINSVDSFVYYDDVNYIKQGWINRNRILFNSSSYLFTLELKGASSNKKINEIEVGCNRNKLLKTFIQAYSKAPFFEENEFLLRQVFQNKEENLSQYIIQSNSLILNHLDIITSVYISSDLEKNNELKGEEKVIEICKKKGASIYINSFGGQELYSKDEFTKNSLELFFLKTGEIKYLQMGSGEFISNLSIVDVLMHCGKLETLKLLDQYNLI